MEDPTDPPIAMQVNDPITAFGAVWQLRRVEFDEYKRGFFTLASTGRYP
jgi:hypothetical protein